MHMGSSSGSVTRKPRRHPNSRPSVFNEMGTNISLLSPSPFYSSSRQSLKKRSDFFYFTVINYNTVSFRPRASFRFLRYDVTLNPFWVKLL